MDPKDPKLAKVYDRLKDLRQREDLALRPTPYLAKEFVEYGVPRTLSIRYYQVQAIIHLMAMNRFVLGDDTGLGKTLMTIAALCLVWEKDPKRKVLILTTKSSVEQWISEFEKFTTGVQTILCKGTPTKREKAREAFVNAEGPVAMVMGHRSAVVDYTHLQKWKGYILVIDEASVCKNPSTQTQQACKFLSMKATRTWALTATLIENNLIDGFGIYQVVVPGLFKSKTAFIRDFCLTRKQQVARGREIEVIIGYRKRDIARFRGIIDPYFLGRPKHEVAKELPALNTKQIKVGLTQAQYQKYQEALGELLVIGDEEREMTLLTRITYHQEIVNHPALIEADGGSEKLDTLIDLLTNGDLAGEKVIVFSRFRRMIDILMETLEAKKIKAVRITGPESEVQRKKAQDLFQDPNSGVNVICINKAGTRAINLQSAKIMLFYDTPWGGGEFLQALGRMIRIGSPHDRVFAYHLVARGTVDERVMQAIASKMDLITQVIGKRLKDESEPEPESDNWFDELFGEEVVGGEEDDVILDENELEAIMEGLIEDAREL